MGIWKKSVAAFAAVPMIVTGLAFAPSAASAADSGADGLSDDALVASYDFEDAANLGKDGSGQGNDLAVRGGKLEYGVPEDHQEAGNAVSLAGGNGQYLELPEGLLNDTDSFTVEFDSKTHMSETDNFFTFAVGQDNQKYFFARLRPSSIYTAITAATNSGEQGVTASQTAGEWHTYRISISPGFIALFVDDELAEINTNVTTKLSDLGTGLPVTFGKSTWGPDKFYKGDLDAIKVWKQAYVSDSMVWKDVSVPGFTEGNVKLPGSDTLGNPITWTSSDSSILDNAGELINYPAEDTDVTFTGEVTIDGTTYMKDFPVMVSAAISDPEEVSDRLLVDYQLIAGATLPSEISGVPGSQVTWESSDSGLVTDDGAVVGASGDVEESVDLTAAVTVNGTSVTKEFTALRVMPKSSQSLASYTRDGTADGGIRVAGALHLALSADGETYSALNQNYGVAFAEAKIETDEAAKTQTTQIRSLTDPYLFRMEDGAYAYVAIATDVNGKRLDSGSILFSTSEDLVQWSAKSNEDVIDQKRIITTEQTAFDAGSLVAGYDASAQNYRIGWSIDGVATYVTTTDFEAFSKPQNGSAFDRNSVDDLSIDKSVPGNTMSIGPQAAENLSLKLGRVSNTTTATEQTIEVEKGTSAQDLDDMVNGGVELEDGTLSKGATATAAYDDGSTHDFRVDWNQDQLEAVDTSQAGESTVSGTIIQQNYSGEFPMMYSRADPVAVYYEGQYYFMGTSDDGGMKALFIRSSDTLAGLKDAGDRSTANGGSYVPGQDYFLWGEADDTGHEGYHWAPELHVITDSDGTERLYCFFATMPTGQENDPNITNSPNWAGPSAYVMELEEGGDPTDASDWIEHRVLAADGGVLSPHGLSIDMTYFEVAGQPYVSWSQGSQTLTGEKAYVAIAKTSKDKPWQVQSDPVRIARPEYGWELDGVNEGSNVLVNDGKVYMVFSAQLVTPQYATGMLIADEGADLTNPDAWTKSNYPWMHNGVFDRQYGLGHNAYFTDPYGDVYNVYHGMLDGKSPRSAAIVPVHFRVDGSPILDMKTSEELNPEYAAEGAMTLTIKVVDEPGDPNEPGDPSEPGDPDVPSDGDDNSDGGTDGASDPDGEDENTGSDDGAAADPDSDQLANTGATVATVILVAIVLTAVGIGLAVSRKGRS